MWCTPLRAIPRIVSRGASLRIIQLLTCAALLVVCSTVARGQSFELYGSAGPTITDAGHSLAAGVGVSPTSRLTLFVNVERTHLSSQIRREAGSASYFRGGTYLLGSAELRFAPLGRGRIGPFAVAGFAAGVSRPNVNDVFPTPVTNGARAVFGGGGLLVPLGHAGHRLRRRAHADRRGGKRRDCGGRASSRRRGLALLMIAAVDSVRATVIPARALPARA